MALSTASRYGGRPVAVKARARKRTSPTVAPLSKVPWMRERSPSYGRAEVSRFLGQSPLADWWERMLPAASVPSSLRNQSSDLLAYWLQRRLSAEATGAIAPA